MSFNDHQKLDVLWKQHRGVAPTSSTKSAHNEPFASSAPIFQKNIWTDSDRIPAIAPLDTAVDGNEIWSDVIAPHKGETAIQMGAEPTADFTAWHAMEDPQGTLTPSNYITHFVPDTFHRSYTVTVWAGNPTQISPAAQRLSAVAEGFEWVFDYTSGILYFPNKVPPIAKQNGIWIEGWTYIGSFGREDDSAGGGNNTSKIKTFTFTTALLPPAGFADFTFPTGGKCILVEAKVSSEATLECHGTSQRIDTNPYRFKSILTHLVDDGSYIVGGNRYYGERFVPLINMDDTTSDVTFWRVYNDGANPTVITVIVKVA